MFSIEKLRTEVDKRTWYHKIDLGHGIITPGYDFDPLWNMVRKARGTIDYSGKRVLDIASWDGMWAFEAERLGAEYVVATDADGRGHNFFFCKQVLNSAVYPHYNINAYSIHERLSGVIHSDGLDKSQNFDIVQHLGLLYHLRDPLWSLGQARSVLKDGGTLLLESAVVLDDPISRMYFNNNGKYQGKDFSIYDDSTTWWAPTVTCLEEMLAATFFEIDAESILTLTPSDINKSGLLIGRACLVAKAISPQKADKALAQELRNIYRNPGVASSVFLESS